MRISDWSSDVCSSDLSMIMMGGPIDCRQSPTQVNRLATTKAYSWFEDNVIHRVPARYPGAGRKVYPGFLQHAGFMAMNPDRHLRSEEHTSALQQLMPSTYVGLCLKKKKTTQAINSYLMM